MKRNLLYGIALFLFILLMVAPAPAMLINGVITEEPAADEILTVNTTLGYCTVLNFPEKPALVTTGDSELIKIEVPKNSKNVLLKPLSTEGVTNLFVFTQNSQYSFRIVIGDEKKLNYVVNIESDDLKTEPNKNGDIPLDRLLKMARNFASFTRFGMIKKNVFTQKSMFRETNADQMTVKIIEGFKHHDPEYLILHVIIQNRATRTVSLIEKGSCVFVNKSRFVPDFVVFDVSDIESLDETHAWFILKDRHISMDNEFSVSLNVEGSEYVFT